MCSETLNDISWQKLFNKYNILRTIETKGFCNISATQIREFREPRLMVKFDHTSNLPRLFLDNKLAILPLTRGDYMISHFEAYHIFEMNTPLITKVTLPTHIQSLDSNTIPSEAIALNCAVASGMIADFIEDTAIVATVSGRMRSGKFSFDIPDTHIGETRQVQVNNAQIEIDAAYEGISCLAIFEAKRDLADDFLIRQLYYPFRVWQNRVTKPVKPIFLVYSNGIYRLFEYAFTDINNYSSLQLIKQKNYSIEDTAISIMDIQEALEQAVLVDEPPIPFPQADKFDRIINLCELLSIQELSRIDVTEQYDFDARQTNYYTDAARYLGLLEKRKENGVISYRISEKGRNILHLGFKKRQIAYCHSILSHRVFNDALRLYFNRGVMPSTEDIVKIMKNSHLYHVGSDSTFIRRSASVKGWLNWIVSLISE